MSAKKSSVIGLVQMQCSANRQENLEKALAMSRDAALQGARIICLPELFLSRYFCQTEDHAFFDFAESIPGPATEAFLPLAQEFDITLILSLFEKRAAGLYHNTTAIIDGSQGYLDKYRKMHIPDDPKFYEKFYFTPGDLGFKSYTTQHGHFGVLICWDQWYPEAARLTALRGAEILFYPTAIGWHPSEKAEYGQQQHNAWEISQRAHAVANGCFVVGVNRIGFEPTPEAQHESEGIEFWGQSFIAAPDGSLLCKASSDQEEVLIAEIDYEACNFSRTHWPFLRDRRIDAYGEITKRFIDN